MLMGAATGLYGHVEDNRKRSILLFGGFIVAIELMALILLFMPTLMFDWAHSPLVSPLGYATRYIPPVALVALLVYSARLWWFVGTVKKAVGFRYVDNNDEPRFCRILEPLAIAAGITTPYAAVIDSPSLNAFACGVRANHMVVVATSGLIEGLDDDELGAVLAHEIMHIKARDTMLLASANTFMATLMMARTKRQVKFDDWRQMIALVVLPAMIPLYLVMAFLTQVALRIGYCSRAAIGSAREMIADAEAVRLTQNPAALVSALRKIEGRSRIGSLGSAEEAMMIDGPTEGPLATHPTVTERIAALARTTGSMIFDGGTRLDTRTPALRGAARSLSFGQRNETLMRVASLAEAPPRATLFQIFRKTRDPERNLFGFNKRGTLQFALVLAAIGLIYQSQLGHRYFEAQRNGVSAMRGLGDLQKQLIACDLGAIGLNPFGMTCDARKLDGMATTFNARVGLPDRGAEEIAEQHKYAASRLARRCYSDRFDMRPADLVGAPRRNSGGEELRNFLNGASQPLDRILNAVPGPARDKALKEYVSYRKLLLNDALYFFGKSGMDEINSVYRRDDHQQVLTLLAERLKDPTFAAGDPDSDVADLKLFATAPYEALPCDTVPSREQSKGLAAGT